MRRFLVPVGLVVAALCVQPRTAEACGGFFCGQQPVDQTAERIVFATNQDGSVTMIVQIAYTGDAADFAWVLPMGSVPDVASLDVFPQLAMSALDANTGPQFQFPDDPDCYWGFAEDAAGGGPPRAGSPSDPDVTVHIRAEVGPYDVAVVESEDPAALVGWLRDNGFRVTSPMEPYVRIYTEEGMKFLALRLQPDSEVSDIQPFRFTLPSGSPSIPLRMTALAAEPEMGIEVFILGDMRYGPANWPEVFVDDSEIVWNSYSWPMRTNWTALVAKEVDEAGGRGFVTEFAGETAPFAELVRSTMSTDEEQIRARDALLPLLEANRYVTRLYTRLSAEEMTLDPIFRRTAGGDVDRLHMLSRYVDGRDLCELPPTGRPEDAATTPCDFTSCGAGGLCRVTPGETETDAPRAGCACVPGTTARTTFDPAGVPTVVCQDLRMSFLNPGDREIPTATPLPDPCVGYRCGDGGECVSMNMTPTCICNIGLVAVGSITTEGVRQTRCVTPSEDVPVAFYRQRLPDLPQALPGGRHIDTPPPPRSGADGGTCSAASGSPSTAAPFGALVVAACLFVFLRRRGARGREG